MNNYYEKVVETARYIKSRIKIKPEFCIILGSGLGSFADKIKDVVEVDYNDIPNFPVTTVEGHSGKLISGRINNRYVVVMKGRFHYYEGYDISQVVYPIRVCKALGIQNLLVTNAAGGINKNFQPGDLMLIKDHISMFTPSPLRGKNIDKFGPRFPDMSEAYSKHLILMAIRAAIFEGIKIKEGIYAFTGGPMYETPAEINMLRLLGADSVGMSTVPEVIAARHMSMKVLGISCITNMAAGVLDKPLEHKEVLQNASMLESKFVNYVSKILEYWE